ncbi:MAG: protein phosphatase 2C domain-containing protein [Thermodesulfobacteriota bacterium]
MKTTERVHLKVKTPHIHASGISDPGRSRADNQDYIFIDASGHFMLLADGMGGHERGAEASEAAIAVLKERLHPDILLQELADITDAEGIPTEVICLSSIVEDAVKEASRLIYERNVKANLRRFMGTTVVGLVPVSDDFMLWFHVGDSRLYRWRNGNFKQLTADHSAYSQWERSGRQGAEPAKHVITRAIGPNKMASADISWEKWQTGDVYLLCSDGLTDMLSDKDISQILADHREVDQIASHLVDAANAAGGRDNVSVVVCKV